MNRRKLMINATALLILPALPVLASSANYTPGLVDRQLAEGKTLFVDFRTSWCVTCAAQKRVIEALRSGNPAYDQTLSFVDVDWDIYSKDALSKRLKIPRRSTLVVLKGNQELGRIVAGTSKKDIKALMDIALQAATA